MLRHQRRARSLRRVSSNPNKLRGAWRRTLGHKQYEAAIHAYKKATPKSADVWNKTGIAYQVMFKNDDALRCYLEAAKLEPANSNA